MASPIPRPRWTHSVDHLTTKKRVFTRSPVFGLVGLARPAGPPSLSTTVGGPCSRGDHSRPSFWPDGHRRSRPTENEPPFCPTRAVVGRSVCRFRRNRVRLRLTPIPIHTRQQNRPLSRLTMRVPLVSRPRSPRILARRVVKPLPFADEPTRPTLPATPFSSNVYPTVPSHLPVGLRDRRTSDAAGQPMTGRPTGRTRLLRRLSRSAMRHQSREGAENVRGASLEGVGGAVAKVT